MTDDERTGSERAAAWLEERGSDGLTNGERLIRAIELSYLAEIGARSLRRAETRRERERQHRRGAVSQ